MTRAFATMTIAATLTVFATTASAQSTSGFLPPAGRLEVGVAASAFFITAGGESGATVAIGPKVIVNFSRTDALQIAADTRIQRATDSFEMSGPYSIAYRRTLIDAVDKRVFVIMGVAGELRYAHRSAFTYTVPAYSVVENGSTKQVEAHTYQVPSSTRFDLEYPLIAIAGIGVERHLTRRLIIQGEATIGAAFVGAGLRASGTLIVPIGSVNK